MKVSVAQGRVSPHLVLSLPGQTPTALASLGGRRYEFTDADGTRNRVTFRPGGGHTGGTELYLETPQRDYVLVRFEGGAESAAAPATRDTAPPRIDITSPQVARGMKLTTQSSRVTVSGRSEQTPEYNPLRNSGHESGDFVFVRKKQ